LNWTLDPGQVLVVRGSNGSGKTTLLRVLAGLSTADSGEVRWNGQRWKPLCASQRESCLYIGHVNALKEELSASENLLDQLSFDGGSHDAAARLAALERVGLASRADLLARRLSQGQKRRVGLARLALAEKPLWLLDEPTNALDDEGVALFTSLVEEHLARGGIACIATHLALPMTRNIRELRLGETTEATA
jgi:heme exporter protein A